jgi:ABC-type antimicrobial peptide transport system permease subunit
VFPYCEEWKVPVGSIARYAIRSVVRNKRRTFAALIGTLLAVTLVAGENIAIDTTASSVLNEMLNDLNYDFVGYSFGIDEVVNGTNALSSVNGVEHVEPVVDLGMVEVSEWGYNGTIDVHFALAHAVRSTISSVAGKFGFATDPSVPSGQVVLTESFASEVGVGIGEELTLRVRSFNMTGPVFHFLNVTVGNIVIMEESEEDTGGPILLRGRYNILFNFNDLDSIMTSLGIDDSGPFSLMAQYYIWVDRSEVVRAGDPDKTQELLTRMHRQLSWAGAPHDITVQESELIWVVQGFGTWLLLYRAVFLALALPAIVLGVYLSIIGSELGLGERRREIGIFKARGSTDRQIFGLLITEALIMGVIAGALGLVFGALSSNLFSVLTPYGLRQSFLEVTVTEFTIVLAIVMAVVLLLIATYRPAKRFAALPVTQTLQKYSKEEAEVKYKPTRDIIFMGLATFNYVGLLYLRDFTGGGSSMAAVMCFLLPIVIVLTPFAPFFLVIGVTSFLTRFTTKIYGWTSRATKFFTKDLHDIVKRNIVRNPKRASSVCVLIAMGLAFGIIVSSLSESQSAHLERTLHAQIGGDISVRAWSVNQSFADDISGVDGVRRVADATSMWGMLEFGDFDSTVWAFNSSAYSSVTHPDQYFFVEGEASSTIRSLQSYGNVIVNQQLADSYYLRVNDQITVAVENSYRDDDGNYASDTDDYQFRVIGIVKVLPGFMVPDLGFWSGNGMYVDYLSLNRTSLGNQTFGFLVDVDGGKDPSDVKDDIMDAFPDVVSEGQVLVYKEELDKARSDPFTGALFNFLMVEFAFALLIIGVGLGLIMYVAATEREGEFASIMSRGASAKQVTNLLLGEAMTIIIIGVVIGTTTGLITAFVFNELISFGMTGGGVGVLDMPLTVSYQTIGLILATIVILIVASLLASLRIRRIDLAASLRKRGG